MTIYVMSFFASTLSPWAQVPSASQSPWIQATSGAGLREELSKHPETWVGETSQRASFLWVDLRDFAGLAVGVCSPSHRAVSCAPRPSRGGSLGCWRLHLLRPSSGVERTAAQSGRRAGVEATGLVPSGPLARRKPRCPRLLKRLPKGAVTLSKPR